MNCVSGMIDNLWNYNNNSDKQYFLIYASLNFIFEQHVEQFDPAQTLVQT